MKAFIYKIFEFIQKLFFYLHLSVHLHVGGMKVGDEQHKEVDHSRDSQEESDYD